MSEQNEALIDFLRESRDGLRKAHSLLGDVRVEVASLRRGQEAQGDYLSDMRAEIRQMGDRLRDVEIQTQRISQTDARMATLEERINGYHEVGDRRHGDLERRVRALEGDGREHQVIRAALVGGVSAVWRYLAGALVGAVIAGLLWAARNEGPPATAARQSPGPQETALGHN